MRQVVTPNVVSATTSVCEGKGWVKGTASFTTPIFISGFGTIDSSCKFTELEINSPWTGPLWTYIWPQPTAPFSVGDKFKLHEMIGYAANYRGVLTQTTTAQGVKSVKRMGFNVPAMGSFYHIGRVQDMEISKVTGGPVGPGGFPGYGGNYGN